MRKTILERMREEKDTYPNLNKEFVKRQQDTQLGYLVRLCNKLGRPLTEEEMRIIDSMT